MAILSGLGMYWWAQLKDTQVDVHIDTPLLTTYHAEHDITYCSPGGTDLKLNAYIPDNKDRTFPLLVYVHGGGWYTGSKDTAAIEQYVPEVARLGYVVASIDYRLAPAHTFPAQVEDVKCAIRFLRAQAARYNINPARVGIMGESAGGYLAAFAGATGDTPAYKTGEYRDESDAVQAVVDLFGPSTFIDEQATPAATRMARNFLSGADARGASVVTHVSKSTPPTLIVHGQDDQLVPYRQSQLLHSAIQAKDGKSTLVPVTNAQHGLSATPGRVTTPDLSSIRGTITSFLAEHLQEQQ